MAYITNDELETFLKLDTGTIDTDQAELAIAIAEADVDTYLGTSLAEQTVDYEVRGTFETELRLPAPVSSIVGPVYIDGDELTASSYRRLGSVLYRPSGWAGPTWMVRVEGLTFGYPAGSVPQSIKSATLAAAARQYASKPLAGTAGPVVMETVGGYQVQYQQGAATDTGEGGLTAAERLRLKRFRWTGGAHTLSISGARWPTHGAWALYEREYLTS